MAFSKSKKIFLSFSFVLVVTNSSHSEQASIHLQEVKIALIGDTEARTNFGRVLKMVSSENANLLMINGDLGYDSTPLTWKKKVLTSININKLPIIATLGNHDVSQKTSYLRIIQGFRNEQNGLLTNCSGQTTVAEGQDITAIDEVCTIGNVSIIGSGHGQVLTKEYLENRLSEKLKNVPLNNWKLVGYHFTLASMNPGLKPKDESTYTFFDLIRQHGAIGVQAHTHSAMASCPISSEFKLDAEIVCHPWFVDTDERFVMPGTGLYLDSSLGGKAARPRLRCKTSTEEGCEHLVDIISQEGYTNTDGVTETDFNRFGALFIVFNVGGVANKAHVFFKSISGEIVFEFNLTNLGYQRPDGTVFVK